jgi:hypothetical protein
MDSKVKILIFLFLSTYQIGSAQLYDPTDNDAKKCNTTLVDLQNAKKLYVKKCSSCHNLYLPSRFSYDKWRISLIKMQKNAKISDQDKWLILKYISLNCKP